MDDWYGTRSTNVVCQKKVLLCRAKLVFFQEYFQTRMRQNYLGHFFLLARPGQEKGYLVLAETILARQKLWVFLAKVSLGPSYHAKSHQFLPRVKNAIL